MNDDERGPWAVDVMVRHRFAVQAGLDVALWAPALFLATWARYDFELEPVDLAGIAVLTVVAGGAQVVVGTRMGLYIHRWRYGTIEEVAALGRTILIVTPLLALVNRFVVGHPIPVSASLAGGVLAPGPDGRDAVPVAAVPRPGAPSRRRAGRTGGGLRCRRRRLPDHHRHADQSGQPLHAGRGARR